MAQHSQNILPPDKKSRKRKMSVALILVVLSVVLPVLCLPSFIPTFFFGTGLFYRFIDTFWIPLALFFFVINPLLGVTGVALAKDIAKDGYANGIASASVILTLVVTLAPIIIFVIVGLTPF